MIFPASCRFRTQLRAAVTLLLLAALTGGSAVRAEVALYEADVAWFEDDAAARENAFRQALRQVLVRVTGLRHLPESVSSEPLVHNAAGLVQQYQLRTATVPSGEAEVHEPRLWVRFDGAAVDRLVQAAGLPVWSRPRPSLLAWVAVRSDGARRMVGAEDAVGIAEILHRGAESRGVPVVLPLLDLEDRVRAGPPERWIEAEAPIRVASERYGPGAILIGELHHTVLWEARWALLLADTTLRWVTEGSEFDLVVDEGLQQAIDALSARFARSGPRSEQPVIVVSVSGVHDFMGYARTVRYLESVDVVESIGVLGVVSGRVRLGLTLRSGVAELRELVALDSTLTEDSGDLDGALALRLLP